MRSRAAGNLPSSKLAMTCSICFNEVEECDESHSCTVCNNTFHFDCMKTWWSKGVGCPLCRNCDFQTFINSFETNSGANTTAEYMLLFTCYVAALASTPQLLQQKQSCRHP